MTVTASLPVISLSKYHTPQALARPLYEASTTAGFFYVVDHSIPESTIRDAFQLSRDYFLNGSEAEKFKYAFDTKNGIVSLSKMVM